MQKTDYTRLSIKAGVIFALAMALTGCWQNPTSNVGLASYDNPKQKIILAKLERQGVKTVHRGQHVRLILSSDYLFPIDRIKLKPEAKSLLKEIAQLINIYSYPARVLITTSTDTVGSHTDQYIRSVQQAREIASYLWNDGVPSDQIKIVGWGSQQPVSHPDTVTGQAHNRRVEIEIW